MIEILHNFFAGITFAAGVTVGAVLCRIATKEGRKEMVDDVKASHARIEERLLGSLKCHERMAVAMELMARKSDGENVKGMARRGGAQIDQTASSASPSPPCSPSSL